MKGEWLMALKWVMKKIAVYVAGLAVSLIALNILLSRGGFISNLLGVDLSFLIEVLTVPVILFFASSLLGALMASRLIKIVSNALGGLSLALAVYLFIDLAPITPIRQLLPVNQWLLMIMLAIIFGYVAVSFSDLYHEPLIGDASTSILIFLVGFALTNIVSLARFRMPFGLSEVLPKVVFWGFTATALVSLLSLLRNLSNPYLHYLGRKVKSNISSILLLLLFALAYFSAIRPYILGNFNLPIPIQLIEWSILCLSFLLFYRGLNGYVKGYLTENLHLGNWTRLAQRIEHFIDPEHLNLAGVIRDFIEHGRKDGIIAYIASIMLTNGVSIEAIREVIADIVEFRDMPYPKICLRPWIKGIDEENRRRRIKLLEEVTNKVNWIIYGKPYLKPNLQEKISGGGKAP